MNITSRSQRPALVACAALLSLLLAGSAPAAPGDLDSSFGVGGKVITDAARAATAVALQTDGRIVAVGASDTGFAVSRFNADGTPDTSFAGDGTAGTDIGIFDRAYAVAIQADGKIVVAGETCPDGFCSRFALARYNADGTPDTSFDGDGRLTTSFGGLTPAFAVAIQPDGKIVAGGSTYSPLFAGFALARYNVDGSLDTSFDSDGKVTTAFDGSGDVQGLAIQTDGKIVAAGSGGSDFALVRYNVDGSLDTTFDTDGKVTSDFGGFDRANDVSLQSDGRILAAGTGSERFGLARYDVDGSLDTTFDGDGRVTTQFFGENIESANALAVDADGRIVAAGRAFSQFDSSFALARYRPTGGLDLSFSGDGKLITDFGDPADVGILCPPARKDCSEDAAEDVVIQADGMIVAVGGAGPCMPPCLSALARYVGEGSIDSTPPTLDVPSAVDVDAEGPAGAIVNYPAAATDDVDGSVPVACAPSSGSLFPIGDTIVECEASDSAGNTAEASFNVHVKGAVEQIGALKAAVAATPATGLNFVLDRALLALKTGQVTRACNDLATFIRLVYDIARPPQQKLTAAQAQALTDAARRIRAVIGC